MKMSLFLIMLPPPNEYLTGALDQWIRRRLRCCVWKQWKTGHRRYVELRKRDVGDKLAAQTAGSNQGPWQISMSPALSIARSDAYFDAIGLPRLSDKRRA